MEKYIYALLVGNKLQEQHEYISFPSNLMIYCHKALTLV